MNKTVTSREQLLAAAQEIAYSAGLSQVSIRAVAAKCGVAVGSIYNYFPTKADLIAAVIEGFWRQTAHRAVCAPRPSEPFPDYVGRLYGALRAMLADFQAGWLSQIAALGEKERQKGRALEANCFAHLKHNLLRALEQHTDRPSAGPAAQTELLVDFTFRNMLDLLRAGSPDCGYLCAVLRALLRS